MKEEDDSAINNLSNELLAERPLIQYLRYNIQFQPKWLKANLCEEVNLAEVNSLSEMDDPSNMNKLSDLGIKAAEIQISEENFPLEFDLCE